MAALYFTYLRRSPVDKSVTIFLEWGVRRRLPDVITCAKFYVGLMDSIL